MMALTSVTHSKDNGAAGHAEGGLGTRGVGSMLDAAVVVTVTTKGVGAPFPTEMLVGTLQLATKGTPVHAKVNVPVKPDPGVACKLNCADCPGETEAVVEPVPGAATITAASPPVP